MRKLTKILGLFFIFFILCGLLLATCRSYPKIKPVPRGEINGALTLDQNWTPEQRDEMNHISFGSRLMPYEWFLHLEQSDSTAAFNSPAFIEALGFIPLKKSPYNPDALPLGFAADKSKDGVWLGLTCTACHSSQVYYQGQRIHVDGAPGMMDFQKFEAAVTSSLAALINDQEKLTRFAKNLARSDTEALISELKDRLDFMAYRVAINRTDTPYGYGRLDAFGQIFNAVSVEALGVAENARSPDAPVSIPVLWDASHLDAVQWNASAPNAEPGPIGQNATTALAVYGTIDFNSQPMLGYTSSVKVGHLGNIQSHFYLLTAPRWPDDIFGAIDNTKAAQGAEIYQQRCVSCHALVDPSDPKRKIRVGIVPVASVGTDPVMANNFATATSKTGILKGKKILANLAGERFGESASTFDLVVHAASSAMANQPLNTVSSILKEWQTQYKVELNEKALNYKARPLNGLWASAPYLHNGSVPTVYDLMLPAAERPTQFYVGALDFDPLKFGINSKKADNTSLFDTQLYGNSNSGHEFGSDLSHDEKLKLIEYLKTL